MYQIVSWNLVLIEIFIEKSGSLKIVSIFLFVHGKKNSNVSRGIKKQFSWQKGTKLFIPMLFSNGLSINCVLLFFYSDLLQGGEYYRSVPLDHGRHCLPHRLHFPVQDGLRPIQCRVSRHLETRIKSEKSLINV